MKFPIAMLREFVDTALSAEDIGELLTMAGFELEGIEEVEGDSVLDIKVVSNRGDGLSVFGLSREVLAKDAHAIPAALYHLALEGFRIGDEADPGAGSKAKVDIETDDCTRYAARIFEGTNNDPAPEWMQRRLRQAGLRPLGKLVDLSNYVMLELGQPLHAFDIDTLAEKRIIVRGAKPGEKLTTLNGLAHELQPHHMMICDANRAVAVAGVMGGLDTEVGPSTKNVLLESAHFESNSVRKTRKELGLNTDASYRFERSVDPNGVVRALNRYAMLLAEFEGDETRVPGVIDAFPIKPDTKEINVRVSRASLLLGMEISKENARSYLERLGFSVSGNGEPFVVQSPSWRPDIVREEDLIEEIGRVHGYEKIPVWAPAGSTPIGGVQGEELAIDNAKDAMLRAGFVQAISHSLRDVHPLDSPSLMRIGPKNPGSPEMAWLRSALWPSLADAALRNGAKDVHLFEIGRVHGEKDGRYVEGRRLAALSIGALDPEHWVKSASPTADFFSIKSAVESTLRALNREVAFEADDSDPRLHPSRQARLVVEQIKVGVMGQIHPLMAQESDLPVETYLAAIDLDAVFRTNQSELRLRSISRNPAVRRDISLLIDRSIEFAVIEGAVAMACGAELEKVWLGDVYAGAGIPEGKHSLTICLQLRKHGENFTDEEANSVRDRAVAALESLGASQR